MRTIQFSPPDISEEEIKEVVEVLRSGWITTGPKTKEFEREIASICTAPYAACVSSATAGLELVLRLFGIGDGDEVIVPAYTYTATASAVCHTGARPVLVDINPEDYRMDKEKLKSLINEKTKAVIPVDIAGVPEEYDEIFKVIDEKKSCFKPKTGLQQKLGRMLVLSDAAHSFGAEALAGSSFVKIGALADFTVFSFHAVKNIVTAEGGAVVWRGDLGLDNEKIYKDLMLYSLHGQSKDALEKSKAGLWEYDILIPGYKYNMTDIQAGLGLAQIKRLPVLYKRRKRIVELYENELTGICDLLKHFTSDYRSSAHLMLTSIKGCSEEKRNKIIDFMAKKGVACNVHYKPLPLLTAYKKMGFDIKDFPNAYERYKSEISLPLHTLLSDEDVIYVADTLKEALKEYA